jgi:hypothetical protein
MEELGGAMDSMRATDDDVARKVSSLWPAPADQERVRAELLRYGQESYEQEAPRVRLAILRLSEGSFERLVEMVVAAKRDFRDVLMWAEYPAEGAALWSLRRDLSEEEQRRIQEIRVGDQLQYRKWLEEK